MQEVFGISEVGFPVEWKFSGWARVDSQNCAEYQEYQWIPGRMRHLISVVYAPYCDYSESPQTEKQQHLFNSWNVARFEFCSHRPGWANVCFCVHHPSQRQALADGFYPLSSNIEDGQTFELWRFDIGNLSGNTLRRFK